MPKVNQLTVPVENQPGTLAHLAKVLGEAKVNIQGFLLTTSGAKGSVKLIVATMWRRPKRLCTTQGCRTSNKLFSTRSSRTCRAHLGA
jgi:hypothetical protein